MESLKSNNNNEISILEISDKYGNICKNGSEKERQRYFYEQIQLIRHVRGNTYNFFSMKFDTDDYVNILDALAESLELSEEYFNPLIQQEAEDAFIQDSLIPELRAVFCGSEDSKIEYLKNRIPLILSTKTHENRMFRTMFQVSAPEEMIVLLVRLLGLDEKRVGSALSAKKA